LFTNFRDSHLSRWYALAMAEHLERAPSPDKPGILIAGLRLAGWGDDRIFGLFGTTLPSLVEACGIRPFVKQFTNAFYGTWMPVSEAGRLLKWLRQDEQFFLNPTDQTLTSLQVGTEERQALRGSLSAAYQGTVMMLEAAVTSNKPLRIIADFS
ncbi:MAG: hypothetical protein M3077_00005, partial [Candidatus Dormibacteraeota bacterium]|nr:hypothetical protein [Candidatus Dormibacteraeota bacterium]